MTGLGRYELLHELGSGGMARVHLARQLDLDRYVALKELGNLQRENAEIVARFVRESRTAGALNHPNIVTVIEFLEHDGLQYIAMEYVERGSLRPWVGRLSLAQFAGIMEGMLAGLAHAHGAGVVHRDLKPENLMVTADGRVKIADFGIAKLLEGGSTVQTRTGATMGTPTYMAPEQAMAKQIGPWTDLYATGVIAYELLAATPPFAHQEPMAVMFSHVQDEPPPLSEKAPGVPAGIAEWTHRLLAKDREARPASAREAWEELEEHVLEALGPRWRREARLESAAAAPEASRPITPAHFPVDSPPPPESEVWETAADQGARLPDRPAREATPAVPGVPVVAPEQAAPVAPAEPTVAPAAADQGARPLDRGGSKRGLLIAGALALVAAVVVAVVVLGGGGGDGGDDPEPQAQSTAVAESTPGEPVRDGTVVPLGSAWIRAAVVDTYEPDGPASGAWRTTLRTLKRDGFTHVVVHPPISVGSPSSSDPTIEVEGFPDLQTYGKGMKAVRDAGLELIVSPYLLVPESYSGSYEPDDPRAFFEAYAGIVGDLAILAGENGADVFVVGEMLSQIDGPDNTDDWQLVIDAVKQGCFDCQTSYAAEDFEEAQDARRLLALMDLPGVNVTQPTTDNDPSSDPDVLTEAWGLKRERLVKLAEDLGKPVWIPGLGYTSRADQAAAGTYQAEGKTSEETQKALFEATFRALNGTPDFAGIGWFEVNGDGRPPDPDDYGFLGKQAEGVLRAWQTAR